MSRLGNSAMSECCLPARGGDRCGVIFPCCGGRPIGEGADKWSRRLKPERFGCLKIDNEIEFGRLYNWEDVT